MSAPSIQTNLMRALLSRPESPFVELGEVSEPVPARDEAVVPGVNLSDASAAIAHVGRNV